MSYFKKIVEKWSHKIDKVEPDLKNKNHVFHLENVLLEEGWTWDVINELIMLLEADIDPDTPVKYKIKYRDGETIQKTTTYANAIKRSKDSAAYKAAVALRSGDKSKEPTLKDKPSDAQLAGDRGAEPGDVVKKEKKPKPSTISVTSEFIDAIDGDAKNKTMNGEEPPPGRESSAVAEIGVGYAMGCLSESQNDMAKAEKCLEKKLSKTKLGKSHGTGDGKKAKDIRKGMLQAAKRENQKVREINEQLGWKNSQTSHIGGSKSSLKATVDVLRERGITEVNGIPIDEYEKVILGGGSGENPTDTMVCIVNEETGEAIMYHTSNKMTSADQIANGSPAKEIKEVVSLGDYSDEERKQAQEAGETARKRISEHREKQKKYIQQQQAKMIEDSKNPEIARKAINRLKGVEDPVSTAADKAKYWKQLLKHPRMKDFMKENGMDPNNLTEEQEIEIYQHYVEEMKKITSLDEPDSKRGKNGMGDVDIQIITRLYGEVKGVPQEEKTTGNPARHPEFSDAEMKSFYDKQTEEMNILREKMNKIKPGSGDKAFADRMAKRLHLDQAEGHDPGGIPNDRSETIMGVYAYKDLKQDKDGNMVQKKGSKFYKLDENGKLTEEEADPNDIHDFDCAVVADRETMAHCLGMKEGESASDDIGIKMGEYEGTKAIIYDREGNQIGVQTARSKSGPGGSMQDSIAYHKDFQRCLAKQTRIQGKCG